MQAVIAKFLGLVRRFEWLGPLLVRVAVGVTFFYSGKGKLEYFDRTVDYFASLGIPFPSVNAAVASVTECVGGLCLVLGLGTRLWAIPLAVTMVVALATAILPNAEDSSVVGFLGLTEVTYLVIFLWLLLAGPGRASLDHLLDRKCCAVMGTVRLNQS